MNINNENLDNHYGNIIKQKRSRKTYDALVKAAFRLLKNRIMDTISIAELASAAGYSVGAFYARFNSKDVFLNALVEHHVKMRRATHVRFFSTVSDERLVEELVANVVANVSRNRGFWLSCLMRSVQDPGFWKPMRDLGHGLAGNFINHVSERLGRQLTEKEEVNIRFAFQTVFGTLNNSVINQPGPFQIKDPEFTENLIRTFHLVSDYDSMLQGGREVKKSSIKPAREK